jgi:hypothetical protein
LLALGGIAELWKVNSSIKITQTTVKTHRKVGVEHAWFVFASENSNSIKISLISLQV